MSTMLDTEFENDAEIEALGLGADKPEPAKELATGTEEIEVVIKDDKPEEDRGRPTADEMSTDDGGSEDEASSYSRKVQERIKKETAKVHAERRAKEDRERQLLEATNYMKTLIRENNQLKEMVEGGEKVLVAEHTGRLQGEIAAAEAAYREAHEAGDVNGMMAAQKNIAKATAKLTQAEVHRTRPLPRVEEAEAERFYRQAQAVPTPDPRAAEWAERNPWFQRDEAMTYMAMAAHRQMVANGIDPTSDDYYRGLDTEMRKRFPEKFKGDQRTEPRRRESVVAPAGRSSNGASSRTRVVLTESQVKLARRLGLTPEQYASQVAAESRGQGEYIHGKS
jgi:hypothetical protein